MIVSGSPPSAPLDVILVAVGSHGDVLPFLALGRELQARGHRVTVCTNGLFAAQVQRLSLDYVEVGTAEEYLAVVGDPDMFHPTRGLKLIAAPLLKIIRGVFGVISERYVPGRTVVAGANTAFAARIAHEKLGVPLATIAVQPAWFFSQYDPPVLHPQMGWIKTAPRFVRRLANGFMSGVMNRSLGVPIGQFRAEIGLPPLRELANWSFSPQAVVGLFPEWFAPRQPDWPSHFQYGDFPLFDEWNTAELAPEVAEFIAAGEPPIVFTPGSAMLHAQPFMRAVADACRRLNRRGMILSAFSDAGCDLPPTVCRFAYAPLSRVLPHTAALVHHGGIGTLSPALRAGVPQLITPFAYDQPDNAWRVARLGAAEVMSMRGITGRRLAGALDRVLHSPEIAAACKQYAAKFSAKPNLDVACRAIESVAGTEKAAV